ncbi:CBS domain-containing protein [Frankia sp. AiPs1]|uniref:CBS domain-containing protein n=1 Tax=Frankia sp. AiPs1 TaxID=573493 RepID=UPI002042C93C|nr:CBS domain-containing protein [Frankia sp. AiPs1]MCM3925373.1 CBS domain-containing protein [Frankia sp. AiPs1]
MVTTVAEIMTRDPATVRAEDTVDKAARLMREIDAGVIVVTENGGGAAAVLTDRDITVRVVAEDRDPHTTLVREVASGDIETVTSDTLIDDAAELMRLRAVRRLPVVDENRIVGVVSLGDLAREGDNESVLGQVSSMPANQ